MGNEKSQPVGLVIEEKAIQADNFWTLHSATYGPETSRKVTVFVGATESGNKPSALERFSKSLMLHRHPNILKYVASWKVNSQYHLATEEVCPLTQVLAQQTPLQICIGLYSVLKAIVFLHEKALSSHNNICQAAVYVTPEGQWKLGGMEYLCRFSDVSGGFLAESRPGRYERGVCPGEEVRVPQPPSAIDQYAYGILTEEVVMPRLNDEVPGMMEFVEVCRRGLQSGDCAARPPLSQLLHHPYFSHQFITIHSFLLELPLKTEQEKQVFFRDLSSKLVEYSEDVVASQLGGLLLSRMVLLDNTAQHHLLPQILSPRSDQRPDCLFSEQTFREHIVPRLMSIFCVRDVQVRLILLAHFTSFCHSVQHSQLQLRILPELLVGIKDTNDCLVAATLRALADLVPILGAATVIGGKRARHFSDGRPKVVRQPKMASKKLNKAPKPAEPLPVGVGGGDFGDYLLSERPSPDGGEAPSTGTATEDESEPWDSWDNAPLPTIPSAEEQVVTPVEEVVTAESPRLNEVTPPVDHFPSLEALDLKTSEVRVAKVCEEENFFTDMEPVISKPSVLEVSPVEDVQKKSKFAVSHASDDDGWGEDAVWADTSLEIN